MRLVMTFTAGDGCTYSCDVALPIEYESAEAAIVEFERDAKAAYLGGGVGFMFAGHELNANDFFGRVSGQPWQDAPFYGPDFLTIDEWFESFSC